MGTSLHLERLEDCLKTTGYIPYSEEESSSVRGESKFIWAFASLGQRLEGLFSSVIALGRAEEIKFIDNLNALSLSERKSLCELSCPQLRNVKLIHLAASLGHNLLLAYLGFMATSVDIKDDLGNSALHHAALVGNSLGVALLISFGAKDEANMYGASAKDLWQMIWKEAPKFTRLEKKTDRLSAFSHAVKCPWFLPDETTIRCLLEEGSLVEMRSFDFAKKRKEEAFLTSHHLADFDEIFPLYVKNVVRETPCMASIRELVLGTFLNDFYIENLPLTGHVLRASRDFSVAEPVVQWFGKFHLDLSLHFQGIKKANPEHSAFVFDNEEIKCPACLIEDGFPNLIYEGIRGISGIDRDLIFLSGTSIKSSDVFTWDYGPNHGVKYGPRVERYLKEIEDFLQEEEVFALREGSSLEEALIFSFERALANKKMYEGSFSENYCRAKLAIDRYRYFLSTPSAQLLVLSGGFVNREGFMNLIEAMPELLGETEDLMFKRELRKSVFDVISKWAISLDVVEDPVKQKEVFQEILLLTQSLGISDICKVLKKPQ